MIRLPRLEAHIYGLWAVSGASLVVAVVSIVANARRPVSAVSDILPTSQIDQVTGRVPRAPAARFQTELRPDDQVLKLDGLPWEQVQRLNLHEVSEHPAGGIVHLLVQRGADTFETTSRVLTPTAWEALVQARYGIAGLVALVLPTLVLWTLTRELLQRQQRTSLFPTDTSGVALWFLTFQFVSISLSVGGMKYPVAWFWTDVAARVVPLLAVAVSLPYPLAPRALRPRWLDYGIAGLSLLVVLALAVQASQLPYAHPDWRRSLPLLNLHDPAMQWGLGLAVLALFPITAGVLLTAYIPAILRLLRRGGQRPALHAVCVRLADRLEQLYSQCPPTLRVIARYQLLILLTYGAVDLLPRLMGGSGGGYSVLFAAIPFSYLLLYIDAPAQRLGSQGLAWMTGLIAGAQGINLLLRISGERYAQSIVWLDLLSILVLALGTVGGGLLLGVDQWRRRVPADPVQETIDGLFTQTDQHAFWHYLVQQVGQQMGVTGWLWVRRNAQDGWAILERTPTARREWLDDPNLQALLTTATLPQPRSTTVDRTALPSVLVVLPLYRDEEMSEALIAANPTDLRTGVNLERNPAIASRLMNAIHVLRRREDEQRIAQQNAEIAARMRAIAAAFQQITRRQRESMFQANRRFSTLLHDETLAELAHLQEQLRQVAPTDPAQQATLAILDEQCRAIGQNLRRIAQELRPAGVRQQLRYTLEHTVMEWEQEYRQVRFDYTFTADEYSLNEYQRDTLYLIISQLVRNALRHAQATRIAIDVSSNQQQLVALVRDDGRGFVFDPQHLAPDALGIRQRFDMAEELGGTLHIETAPGQGCSVTLRIPYPNNATAT